MRISGRVTNVGAFTLKIVELYFFDHLLAGVHPVMEHKYRLHQKNIFYQKNCQKIIELFFMFGEVTYFVLSA